MRIAVISDIHGNYAALDAVLADISRRGADLTIGLGDFLSGPFDPRAVADRLIAENIPGVRGNHDRWLVEGREENDWAVDVWVRGIMSLEHADWLRAMPLNRVVEGEVFMCHATPEDDNVFWMDALTDEHGVLSASRDYIEAAGAGIDFPVLLCGHTHVPRTLRLSGGRLLVNPGSVGLPFLLGSPDARYAILERHAGDWSVELLAIPYDRTPAQAQARALGYPGFARAIETGWATLKDL
jgi:putative phosphoesterase